MPAAQTSIPAIRMRIGSTFGNGRSVAKGASLPQTQSSGNAPRDSPRGWFERHCLRLVPD
jgi:hypothetical protein